MEYNVRNNNDKDIRSVGGVYNTLTISLVEG